MRDTCPNCGYVLKSSNPADHVASEPAKHFHTMNCPLDPETRLCPIGYDGVRK